MSINLSRAVECRIRRYHSNNAINRLDGRLRSVVSITPVRTAWDDIEFCPKFHSNGGKLVTESFAKIEDNVVYVTVIWVEDAGWQFDVSLHSVTALLQQLTFPPSSLDRFRELGICLEVSKFPMAKPTPNRGLSDEPSEWKLGDHDGNPPYSAWY